MKLQLQETREEKWCQTDNTHIKSPEGAKPFIEK
jgi:hypothetical protein